MCWRRVSCVVRVVKLHVGLCFFFFLKETPRREEETETGVVVGGGPGGKIGRLLSNVREPVIPVVVYLRQFPRDFRGFFF